MDIAKKINAADEYIELDRKAPEAQWKKLKEDNPYGFDVVVEATGVEKLANESINYVRRGGTLMIYGVYENSALVHWPPSKVSGFILQAAGCSVCLVMHIWCTTKIFGDEIKVCAISGLYKHKFMAW